MSNTLSLHDALPISQAGHLYKVPDAQILAAFLRQRGLTNRFQGAFRIPESQFAATIPRLAEHPYVGGADVLFASLSPQTRFTALACHHFDIHFTTPDARLLETISERAAQHGLCAETLTLPELPDFSEMWK